MQRIFKSMPKRSILMNTYVTLPHNQFNSLSKTKIESLYTMYEKIVVENYGIEAGKFYFEKNEEGAIFVLGEGVGTILVLAKQYKGQIYMHSPVTGGKWYEYDGKDWLNSDKETLMHRLALDVHALVKDFPNGGEELQKVYDKLMEEEKTLKDEQDRILNNPQRAKLTAKRIAGQAPPERFYD